MKRILLTLAATFTITVFGSSWALAEKAVSVPQKNAPVKIVNYETDFDTKADKTRVVHEVKYQNTSKKETVAVRLGFLEFNAYNEKIDGFFGHVLEESSPGEKDSGDFINEAPHAPFFKAVGTGYVWVDAVRFSDGSIWKADRIQLLEEMRKINVDITIDDLSDKKSLPAD